MNERYLCPQCESVRMEFIWSSPQSDPDVEAIIGRFQICWSCGWQGDVTTGERIDIRREGDVLIIDGTPYPGPGPAAWLRSTGLV